MTFQIADVVRLKSGGPLMTLAKFLDKPGYGGESGWLCFWFVQGASRRGVFPEQLLELAPDEKPPARKLKLVTGSSESFARREASSRASRPEQGPINPSASGDTGFARARS